MDKDVDEVFNKIACEITELGEIEKKFALWYLLREFEDKELKLPDETPKTLDEYKEFVLRHDIGVSVNHLIEILGYEIFG